MLKGPEQLQPSTLWMLIKRAHDFNMPVTDLRSFDLMKTRFFSIDSLMFSIALRRLQHSDGRHMRTLALGFEPDDIIYDGTSIWVACSTNGTGSKITRAQ